MKKKLLYYLKEVAIFIVVMIIVANGVSFYKSQSLDSSPVSIEEIILQDSSFLKKDKAILLHFWATWCPVCKVEASNIEAMKEEFNVISVAVNSGEDENIAEYMRKNSLNFYVFNDSDGMLAKSFNIQVYPTTLVYDQDKKLVFSEVGYTSSFGLWIRLWWASL